MEWFMLHQSESSAESQAISSLPWHEFSFGILAQMYVILFSSWDLTGGFTTSPIWGSFRGIPSLAVEMPTWQTPPC